ncbi:ABC transporter permease [Olivibacter sitiensis]|uniref:ABC transporter permease n=1 Tax=Olivibacter sitiensis TaxID=376470 RepID=UPI00041D1B49|nr:iron chelate uptake ABC transporter family permease subunit [Olivibacter sitiensis]
MARTGFKHIGIYIVSLGAALVLVWLSFFIGVKDIRFADLWSDGDKLSVFLISRVPRTLSLVLTGAGLSIAGFIMQQLSQNRFVAPSTAGTLQAAKMGILFSVILIPGATLLNKMLFSMAFTLSASILFMFMIRHIRFRSATFIPLVGILFGNILEAISTFFAYKNNIVQNTQQWLLGDFSSVIQGQYEAVYLILPVVFLGYLYADRFTIAGMGESFAKNLGLSYGAIVGLGLISVSLVVSAIVVSVGAIPFVGLIVPNIVSMLFGDNLRRTLPITAMAGAILLLACDIIGRLIVFPYEIPIGVMIGMLGGIIFLFIILRRSK